MLAEYKNNKNESGKSFFRNYVIIALIFAALFIGYFWGTQSDQKQIVNENGQVVGQLYNEDEVPDYLSRDVDFDIFWQVWDDIKKDYAKQPVSDVTLFYGALQGLTSALKDPHSVFLNPDLTEEFNQELDGSFEGIGAEIANKNGRLTIVAPLPGTPADRSGLKAGDKVFFIDDLDTTNIALDYAVSKIRGPKGTEVVLTVGREGNNELIEIPIVRDEIHIISVQWEMKDNDVALITLSYFNFDTQDEFDKILDEIIRSDAKSIILDLRNNPGGLLDTAIEVASEWVEDGIVVSENYADGSEVVHRSRGKARFSDYPTIVMINGGSASGSEIVAGALKDHDIAQLLGETSFGKGSVQTLYDFADGSSLKLTIARWLTPNGVQIDGEGIAPDVEIELTDEDWDADLDPQLKKALELLKNYH